MRREWLGHLGEELMVTFDNVFVVELTQAEYVAELEEVVTAFAATTTPPTRTVEARMTKLFFNNAIALLDYRTALRAFYRLVVLVTDT
jgi:hypothetical protein